MPRLAQRPNGGFNLLGGFGQRGRAVGRGELDAVVLRRIVRGGEIDGAGGLLLPHCVGDRRGGRRFRNDARRDAVGGEDAGSLGDEDLAQEAGIAADQHRLGSAAATQRTSRCRSPRGGCWPR